MLEAKDLRVKYHNTGKLALAGVSFNVNKGEVVAILGPSGCGKTTLLNVISGLLDKDEIEISGEIIFEKKSPVISMVFQTPNLLPWRNASSNISFGLEIKNGRQNESSAMVNEMLDVVGLKEYGNYLPSQLSLGMKQRINFARAIVTHPDILILDEPFASLDDENKNKLRNDFLNIIKTKGITSIFVTHDKEEAMLLADKIITLTDSPATVDEIVINH